MSAGRRVGARLSTERLRRWLLDSSRLPPSALPSGLAPGVSAEAKAIVGMTGASGAVASQLPIGLGAQSAAYDKVFVDTFTAIALNNAPIAATLAAAAVTLQSALTQAGAACWKPDPASTGVCQVG